MVFSRRIALYGLTAATEVKAEQGILAVVVMG